MAGSPTFLHRLTRERRFTYALAVAAVAFVTLAAAPFREIVRADSLAMLYLTMVVAVAAWQGAKPAIAAALLSVAAFNFFLTKPYYTFLFYDRHYYVTLGVMLVLSMIVGPLTARVAHHARVAEARAHEMRRLYDLSRALAEARTPDEMTAAARRILGADIAILDTAADGAIPLISEGERLGWLKLIPDDNGGAVASLLASALQRAGRTETATQARIDSENEKLRNVLLASLSHDLRTPLTAINGGLVALLRLRKKLPREAMDEVTRLWGQSQRLQGFVDNVLRMAALTSGRMTLNRQPYLIQEIVGASLAQVAERKGERAIRTVTTGELPLVDIDGALIGQVLVNLLDNAIRHTAEDGVIVLSARRDGAGVAVSVEDNGPGLPPGLGDDIFDAFRSAGGGTGLGLAICKGVVEAHGGRIHAETVPGGGARFTFFLPGTLPGTSA